MGAAGQVSLVDRCPDCRMAVYAKPLRVSEADRGGGVIADYKCPRGHAWYTSWAVPLRCIEDAA